MKAYKSINLYSYPVIISLGLAYGLADTSFIFTLYTIYTFLTTLISRLIDTNYIAWNTKYILKFYIKILIKFKY